MTQIPMYEAIGGPTPRNEGELNMAGAGGMPDGGQQVSIILLGEKVAAGSQAAGTISDYVNGVTEAEALAGVGSPVACMARFLLGFDNNKVGKPKAKLRLAVLNEEATGTKAEQTLTFVTTATADGTWQFKIGRFILDVNVKTGNDATAQAAAFVAAFNKAELDHKLPLVASNVAGVAKLTGSVKSAALDSIGLKTLKDADVTTTATWSGTYMGDDSGTGVDGVGVQSANLTAILAAIRANKDCGSVVTHWNDDATLELLIDEMNTRGNATNKVPSYLYAANNAEDEAAKAAARAAQITWSTGLDSDDAERVSPHGVYGSGDWHGFQAVAAAALRAGEPHLARSLNGLEDDGAPVPAVADAYDGTDTDLLLEAGLCPWYVHEDSTKLGLTRHVMCRDSWGVKDFSKIQVADYVRARVSYRLGLIDRPSIVADTAVLPNAPHVTQPKLIKATVFAELKQAERDGYITNAAALFERVLQELNGTELRQAFPIEVVEQLHNIMTRYDVGMD